MNFTPSTQGYNRQVAIKVYRVFPQTDGRMYAVELRNNKDDGPLFASPVPTSGTTANVAIGASSLLNTGRPVRAPNHGGRGKAIRFWPHIPSGDVTLIEGAEITEESFFDVRYIYRPEDLIGENDTPALPEEFHQIIIDRVVSTVHLRHSNLTLAQLHARKADERLKVLEGRYGSNKNTQVIRGKSMSVGVKYGDGFDGFWPGTVTLLP